jgi:hypothetical protein
MIEATFLVSQRGLFALGMTSVLPVTRPEEDCSLIIRRE